MNEQSLITLLFTLSSISSLIMICSLGIVIWFRKPIGDRLKLKYLMKFGYVIAELIRHDKTRVKVVVIPNKETNSVKFPGVEGLYTLDDASVTLTDRKYPTYTWNEGETAPLNFEKETYDSEISCPHCKEQTIVKVKKPKSIAPAVLDNLIIKIKTLSQMMELNKIFMYAMIGLGISIIVGGVTIFLIDDFKRRFGEIAGKAIYDNCGRAINERMSQIITP